MFFSGKPIRPSLIIHFHPSTIFARKSGSLPLEWYLVEASTLEGSSLAWKFCTRVEANGTDTHNLAYYNMETITAIRFFYYKPP